MALINLNLKNEWIEISKAESNGKREHSRFKENTQVFWDGAFEELMWKPRPWMLEKRCVSEFHGDSNITQDFLPS